MHDPTIGSHQSMARGTWIEMLVVDDHQCLSVNDQFDIISKNVYDFIIQV